MQDETFEKLGQFYLGKQYDMDRRERTEQPLLYDSRDLCTHAVVVGMTGSGKTGLCIDLLEEAAMDNIPAIVIDPKRGHFESALNISRTQCRRISAVDR